MKTRYKYIHFDVVEVKAKTKVWVCRNNRTDGILANIMWYSTWRQYCFFPVMGAVYNDTCLDDISHFLKQLRVGRKSENKTEGGG